MSEQATDSSYTTAADGPDDVLERLGDPTDIDIDAEAASAPDLDLDAEMYETPDDLGGTGGPDAGGAG